MILRHLIRKLDTHFPGQFNVAEAAVTFPAKHSAVGGIEVHDDGEELTVYVGNFSHLHFSKYDESLSKEQAAEHIADDVTAFLKDLFADKIVMWGFSKRSRWLL